MNVLELSEQEILRRQSLDELRKMGINPYPAAEYPTNAFSTEIRDSFSDDAEPRQVSIAGRMMSRRVMGKASFVELQDSKGRIQVYITRDDLCPGEDKELYNTVFKKLLDIGDFIGVRGFVFRTQTGEISVHCQELTLLSKALKPLPIVKYKDGVVEPLNNALEKAGFHLLHYPNCEKLFEELSNSFFDVALVNVKIDTNISDFHDKLQKQMPDTGAVYILNDDKNLESVKQKGCFYLTKPFEIESVINLINKILGK